LQDNQQSKIHTSVIVRSYNRYNALMELLDTLLKQAYEHFEIIVVEQSTNLSEAQNKSLTQLEKNSAFRLKFFWYKPLGGPQARNEGVKHAIGDILIFIDDDDLPENEHWVSEHVQHFEDKELVGLTGRHIFEGNTKCPYLPWMRWFIRKTCMKYNWLKFPYTFAQFNEDVNSVDWLHGTNSSIRREWAIKAGLWDTHVRNQDEHSLAFKLKTLLKNGYRLDFKKSPTVIRRMDLDGGMEKRKFSIKKEFMNQYKYLTRIVYKYNPGSIFLFPIQYIWIWGKVLKYALSNKITRV